MDTRCKYIINFECEKPDIEYGIKNWIIVNEDIDLFINI